MITGHFFICSLQINFYSIQNHFFNTESIASKALFYKHRLPRANVILHLLSQANFATNGIDVDLTCASLSFELQRFGW